ncbi:hypothetical protein BDN72DRAFT_905149 [Pluteus cervinus]|uniref:Uncharacterized protein n=1 Tax=Pluteus cervinus TaxID=181527 RepID=A0ACD3A2Z3_9AGAR|nr:hypothetical protein BDN72DRAFT_905149 [Pluteus cervinus]
MSDTPISVAAEFHRFYTHLETMEADIGEIRKDFAGAKKTLLEGEAVLTGLSSLLKALRQRIDEAVLGHGALEICAEKLETNGKLEMLRSTLLKHITKDITAKPVPGGPAANGVESEDGQRKRIRNPDDVGVNASKRAKKTDKSPAASGSGSLPAGGSGSYHLGG